MTRRARRITLGFSVLLLLGTGACSRGQRQPNLVLITIDTLRPNHLGYTGYARATSPTIDRLGREGVVFTNATSVSGWTLPSVATIMSGHYPKDHGATDFQWSMDPRLYTLAGTLRRNGYDTWGFVSHVLLTQGYGLADGFAHYDASVLDVGKPHEIMSSEALTRLALRGLRDARTPYFLWVHYFDPHFEYLAHPQFPFGDSEIDHYDAEIAYTDSYIGQLLAAVDEENTVIVVVADHGEEFGEHGSKYHYTLHGEVIQIPLIIKAPSLAPRVDTSPAEQTDLMPTILGLLGVEPPAKLPGRDLFATSEPADAPVFLERNRPPQWSQKGVVRGDWKLIVVENADTTIIIPENLREAIPVENVEPGMYLFDLARDPGEQTSVFARDDTTSLELLGLVTTHFANAASRPQPVDVDADLLQKLRSLGYVR